MTKTPADSLIAKWRAHADQQMQWSRESNAKGDGANAHTERARARIYRECADELTTLLSGEGESRREQEKDSGAGLIHQVAGPLAETEPRPNSEARCEFPHCACGYHSPLCDT